MAIGAFPLIKLGALALRQISKPLANHLKTRAKSSHFFRTKICMPPAQFYHWCEVNVKARLLNLGKPKEVVKLNEQAAIDLGSELIGEFVMFIIAAATITAEYVRQSRKYADEKVALELRWSQLESKLSDLETRIELSDSNLGSRIGVLEDKQGIKRPIATFYNKVAKEAGEGSKENESTVRSNNQHATGKDEKK